MAKRAETARKPPSDWGMASRVARRSVLAMSLLAGASGLQAQALEAGAAPANQSTPIAAERETTASINSPTASGLALSLSVSAFSAAQSDTARVLLAQEPDGESNRAVGVRSVPATPGAGAATRRGEVEVRQSEAAEAKAEEEAAIVGRALRAFTRDQEKVDTSTPRRRASFSSAISRAAAAGALTSTNPNASVSNALSSSRFIPATNAGQFDPGFSQAAEVLSVVPGLRLESATIFGGYSSNSVPRSVRNGGDFFYRNQDLGADYDLGASAILAYTHQGRRSLTRFSYAPSHVQRSRIPEWSTTDHHVSFQSSRDLTPRLSLQGNGNAGSSGLEQFWTRPAVIRQVDAPESFAELVSKVLAGEITNDEFAALLTGSPVVDDPGGSEADLMRVLSASLAAGGSYAYSRRMTINFGAAASLNRRLSDNFQGSEPGLPYLSFARTTSAHASANYRLSSRTRVAVKHITAFADSTFLHSVSHSPSVEWSQTLSRHWNYQVAAGIGTIGFDRDRSAWDISNATTWTADGLLGYTSGAHHFSLSASKRVGDPLGFGSRSTAQASVRWAWQPRFSPWGADAGIAFSRSDISSGPDFGRNFASDLYSVGLSRRLAPSTTFRSDYYYGDYASPYSGVFSNMTLHRLQLSLMWRPVERR